jgi:adenylosuccinate synthase
MICDLICDLQFGSTGKGLIAGYLAKKYGHDTVMTSNMPNAGHTYIDEHGRKFVHHVLGNGIVGPAVTVAMIGPGSVFSLAQLYKEMLFAESAQVFGQGRVYVHENAWLVTDELKGEEASLVSKIGSTGQGSAAAMIQKIGRSARAGESGSAGDNMPHYIEIGASMTVEVLNSRQWNEMLRSRNYILVEGSQGYSLGINAGFFPFSTSRDCTPARIMADCQMPLSSLREVIGTCRVHPIRVAGNSGDGYADQEEMSWEDVGVAPEKTTTTGRDRRIFSFSNEQITEALYQCQPSKIFLNFANYDEELAVRIKAEIEDIACVEVRRFFGVRFVGHGATQTDIEDNDFEKAE